MDIGGIGASGIIVLVVLMFVSLGFAKGALKLFYGFICFIGTIIAAWAGYYFSVIHIEESGIHVPRYIAWICAIVAGMIGFWVLNISTKFFIHPFASGNEKTKESSLWGVIVGFVIGFGVCLFAVNRLIDTGTRAEIQFWLAQVEDAAPDDLPSFAKLKYTILNSSLGKHLGKMVLKNRVAAQNLVKLAIMQVAAPENLKILASDPKIAATLENPQLAQFLSDPIVREYVKSGDTARLVKHPGFLALVADSEMNQAIAQIDIEQVLKLR